MAKKQKTAEHKAEMAARALRRERRSDVTVQHAVNRIAVREVVNRIKHDMRHSTVTPPEQNDCHPQPCGLTESLGEHKTATGHTSLGIVTPSEPMKE